MTRLRAAGSTAPPAHEAGATAHLLDPAADPDAVAWQTAYDVVLDEPPQGRLGEPTMMDFRQPSTPGDVDVPTFAYAFPVTDGWLVEETVLAGPRIDPEQLVPRLASRLAVSADELASIARRVGRVGIPMGAPIPTGAGTPAGTIAAVRFGAAAGMIHTATGYSVAASLRAADRVAGVIATRLGAHAGAASKDDIHESEAAIWPRSLRRARRLHDYGLDVLLDMDAAEIRTFFETFFALSDERWASYLRIDSSPRELAGTMAAMFRRADWSLRRRLLSGDLRLLLAALRL